MVIKLTDQNSSGCCTHFSTPVCHLLVDTCRAYEAAHDEQLPLADRLAIRLAFSYLLQYSAAGRRPSETALSSAAAAVAVNAAAAAAAAAAEAAAAATGSSSGEDSSDRSQRRDAGSSAFAAATAAASVAVQAGGRSASEAAKKGLALLQKIPLPILRTTDSADEGDQEAGQQQQQQQYVLTQAEERLVQVRGAGSWLRSGLGCRVTHALTWFMLVGFELFRDSASPMLQALTAHCLTLFCHPLEDKFSVQEYWCHTFPSASRVVETAGRLAWGLPCCLL